MEVFRSFKIEIWVGGWSPWRFLSAIPIPTNQGHPRGYSGIKRNSRLCTQVPPRKCRLSHPRERNCQVLSLPNGHVNI